MRRLIAHHGSRRLGLGEIPRRADDLRPVRNKGAGRLDAKPRRDAGDEHALFVEIDAREHLVGGRGRPE